MYKYINFNNLRKKKRFASGGVMVGWSSLLWKHKKQLKKYKKKENKIRKTIYSWNNENFFLLFSKKWFLRIWKKQITKTHPLPQTSFFFFKNKKQFLKIGTKQASNLL